MFASNSFAFWTKTLKLNILKLSKYFFFYIIYCLKNSNHLKINSLGVWGSLNTNNVSKKRIHVAAWSHSTGSQLHPFLRHFLLAKQLIFFDVAFITIINLKQKTWWHSTSIMTYFNIWNNFFSYKYLTHFLWTKPYITTNAYVTGIHNFSLFFSLCD